MARIFSYSGRNAKISLKFTDKQGFLSCLSVSKTHFTDKPASFNDLSVNFWSLWWWFTDTSRFLEHLSVKPGPNRLNFYGQTAIFDHFVRKRHFSSKSITDSMPIFIDLSVNGSDFEFVLLSRSRAPNFDKPVDKKEAFLPFFVYFWYRAPRFRRTAEIPPKQETLRRCLMPVALHFEFPSRKLSRFVAVRASKDVRASFKALHYQR